jgi:hypothetical protein
VTTDVLSQHVTGVTNYLIDAKVNAPFGNNAKQVTCTLTAVENGVATVIDSSDTLLIGSSTTTAKGVLSLNGRYVPTGGSAVGIDLIMGCATAGDTRILTKGAMNIYGAKAM